MKDVAGKLKDWKDSSLMSEDIMVQDLIFMQMKLLNTFYNNSNGKNGKLFLNIRQLPQMSLDMKIYWSNRNILRLFDQIAQCRPWYNKLQSAFSEPKQIQFYRQNLMFQLIDILHFVFNVAIIWDLKKDIKDFRQLQPKMFLPHHMSEQLTFKTSELLNCTSWKHWKNRKQTDLKQMVLVINSMLQYILSAFIELGYNTLDIYRMYGRKNRQNSRRQIQTQGYKN